MKIYCFLVASVFVLLCTQLSCNDAGERSESKQDTAFVEPAGDTVTMNALEAESKEKLEMIQAISDSFNTAIVKLNEVTKGLAEQAEAANAEAEKRTAILNQRNTITGIRDEVINSRNSVTAAALQVFTQRLIPCINTLKSQKLKLDKLGASLETVVSIFGFVDKALEIAISKGILKAPVAIAQAVAPTP